jgi:hypothetical protein
MSIKCLDTTLTYGELVSLANIGLAVIGNRNYPKPSTTLAVVLLRKLLTPYLEGYTELAQKIAPPSETPLPPSEIQRRERELTTLLAAEITVPRLPCIPLADLLGIENTDALRWTVTPALTALQIATLLPIAGEQDDKALTDLLSDLIDLEVTAEDE